MKYGDTIALSSVVSGLDSDNDYDVAVPGGQRCEITVYGGLTSLNIHGPGPVALNVFGSSVIRIYDGDAHAVHIAENVRALSRCLDKALTSISGPGAGARGVLLERDGGTGYITSEVSDHDFSKL